MKDIDFIPNLVAFASKDEYRPNLCGVYIDNHGNAASTDGHRLLVVREFTRDETLLGKIWALRRGRLSLEKVDGQFPDYKLSFPAVTKHAFEVKLPKALSSLSKGLAVSITSRGRFEIGADSEALAVFNCALLRGLPELQFNLSLLDGKSPMRLESHSGRWTAIIMPMLADDTFPATKIAGEVVASA